MSPSNWPVLFASITRVFFASFITAATSSTGNGDKYDTCKYLTAIPYFLSHFIASKMGNLFDPNEMMVMSALSHP